MINQFQGIGNLGTNPTLTPVGEPGPEQRKVTNMRMYFDRPVLDGNNGYKDKGGFWYSVDMWGFRAEEAVRLLKKGSRIFVSGSLREETWTDEQGEERTRMRLTADYFFIDSLCIERIHYKEKSQVVKDDSAQRDVVHEKEQNAGVPA